jgi:hypothetical protein
MQSLLTAKFARRYSSKRVFMTFAQMLLFGYLALSFVAAVIVYAACAIAGRQANKPANPLPRTRSSNRHPQPPLDLQPTVTSAFLKHEAKPPIDPAPVTIQRN